MASGDTLAVFTAQNNEPPDLNFATPDTRPGAANAQQAVLDFDASADESAEFGSFMPNNYSGGGLTVTLIWGASTATSGDCVWDVSCKSVTDDQDDLDTKAFAAAQSVTAAAPTASGEFGYDDVTFTAGAQMDSIAPNEYFRMRVTRNIDPDDDMTGDAELLAVIVKET